MTSEKSVATPVQQARKLLQTKKIDTAVQLLTRFLDSEPRDRDGHELLGMAHFMSKKYEDALAAFETLTRIDRGYSAGWVNLGAVQNVTGDYQAATRSLRKAIRYDMKSASAYYNLGIAQKALKMNSMAISAYKEAIKLDPTMEEAYVNLANIFIEMSNYTQALRTVDSGLKACAAAPKLEVIRRKAVDLKEGKRRSTSPFGRLVDEEALSKKQIRTGKRNLTAHQRNEERDTLKALAKSARKLNEPVVHLLNGPLNQQLHLLSLAAAQKDSRGEAVDAFDAMTKTLSELDQLRSDTMKVVGDITAQLQRTDPGL